MSDHVETLELPHAAGVCRIHVGRGLAGRVADLVPALTGAGRAFLVVDERLVGSHARTVAEGLAAAGVATNDPGSAAVVAHEAEKRPETVTRLHEAMASAQVERSTPVVAIGGGITGDVAGFAAATWRRGVPVVQVPTTLLAMVDAAIGGKTGVNLPRADGGLRKNMIGAFWQPLAVVSDPEVLATLEPRELRCGLAECVKHGMIAAPELLAAIDRDRAAILAADPAACGRLVAAAARVKVATVAADEREAGVRAHLNLGHTFGHAIEALAGGEVRHGEAVAIGLVAAARLAAGRGRLAAADVDQLVERLESLGLPVRLPAALPVDRLLAAMRDDKKVAGGRLRLVLAGPPGTCTVVDDADEDEVRAAWAAVGAT